MKCRHCQQEFNGTKSQFANHSRWCDKNPKAEFYRRSNSDRGTRNSIRRFGEYKEFDVVCSSCTKEFKVREREFLFPTKEQYFCSKGCANSVGGKAKATKYHYDEVATYTTVAWRHHERKCIICGEDKIVAIHHLNENHNDNRPENLVPLCPTHHGYWHSRYRSYILQKVEEYVRNKWGQ